MNGFNFLGIIMDKHHTVKKSKSVGILYKLNGTLPASIMKLIDYALVYPCINYGIEIGF